MTHGASILVIDGLSETTEVLKAVFEPQGHVVHRIRQRHWDETTTRPRVVVWHDDGEDTPRVLVGKTLRQNADSPARRFSQPFEYGELLRAVEDVLDDRAGRDLE